MVVSDSGLGSLPVVDGLEPEVRLLALLAGHAAAGDLEGVAEAWQELPPARHSEGLEVLLQTLLFAGFPRIINAVATVRSLGAEGGSDSETDSHRWTEQGEELCGQIYGSAYEALRGRMKQLHPLLDRWMVEMGYGRVLSRTAVTPRIRELCAVAVLAGLDVPAQLESHLRGAQRVGASAEEVRGILDQTAIVWGPEAQARVNAQWERLNAARSV